MTATNLHESEVEEAALSWFDGLGYGVVHGEEIAPEQPGAERESFSDVLLLERLRDALDRLNPNIPEEAREDAFRKIVPPVRHMMLATTQRTRPALLAAYLPPMPQTSRRSPNTVQASLRPQNRRLAGKVSKHLPGPRIAILGREVRLYR